MKRSHTQFAFSLVELSIVLVILGLLVGGVLSGQSLIRAAELRSVATETTRYITATHTFRDKYFAIPGDMPNAVKFWGAQAGATTDGTDAACIALLTPATGTATCNGNGNGQIAAVNAENYEVYRAWQHLANAGLIEGSYSGVTAAVVANTFGQSIGVNGPRSKLNNAGYTFVYYAPVTNPAAAGYFVSEMGNLFWFGSASVSYTSAPILRPEEAWNIDTKMDDGKPAYGIIISTKSATTCNTSTTPSASEYALTQTGLNCQLIIRTKI